MQIHASCADHDGFGVLLVGEPGSGKSDLLLRLLDHGYALVADDRVELDGNRAWAPASLAGLVEIRGLGIVRFPYLPETRLAIVARMGEATRLPGPATYLALPEIHVDPNQASAPARIDAARRCLQGRLTLVVGALA